MFYRVAHPPSIPVAIYVPYRSKYGYVYSSKYYYKNKGTSPDLPLTIKLYLKVQDMLLRPMM